MGEWRNYIVTSADGRTSVKIHATSPQMALETAGKGFSSAALSFGGETLTATYNSPTFCAGQYVITFNPAYPDALEINGKRIRVEGHNNSSGYVWRAYKTKIVAYGGAERLYNTIATSCPVENIALSWHTTVGKLLPDWYAVRECKT